MKKLLVIVLVVSLFGSCASTSEVTTTKKNVDAVTGSLTLHPLSVEIPTKEEKFFCILDAKEGTIFITSDEKTFEKISNYLPLEIIPNRVARLEGTLIDPFTIFTKEEFSDMNSKFAKLGIQLNGFKIARLFNAGLLTSSGSSGNNSKSNDFVEKKEATSKPIDSGNAKRFQMNGGN